MAAGFGLDSRRDRNGSILPRAPAYARRDWSDSHRVRHRTPLLNRRLFPRLGEVIRQPDRDACERHSRHPESGCHPVRSSRDDSPSVQFVFVMPASPRGVDDLVIVLIIAAVISATLGLLQGETADLYDAVLIIVIVIMNAILGFVQEYRAERSLEALKSLAAPKAHVLREGGIVAVPSRELVPGEVVVLAAGDRVPADARLLEVARLRVNEASLTGESLPVSQAMSSFSSSRRSGCRSRRFPRGSPRS